MSPLENAFYLFIFFGRGSFVDPQYAGPVAFPHFATATVASRDEGNGRATRPRLRSSRPHQLLPPSRGNPASLRSARATGENRRCVAHATRHWRRTPHRAHALGSR